MNVKMGIMALPLLVSLGTNVMAQDVSFSVSETKDWGSGFCAKVVVSNPNDYWSSWNIEFHANGAIFTMWDASYTQDTQSLIASATGEGWTQSIEPLGSVSFGYCANRVETPEPIEAIDLPESNVTLINHEVYNQFNVGFGGGYSIPFASSVEGEKIWVSSVNLVLDDYIEYNGYYAQIKNFNATAFDNLQNKLKNSKFLVYWLVEGWDESWFNTTKIQNAMNAGYIPVFNYWYFGDNLDGVPSQSTRSEYQADHQRVIEFLNQLSGTKMLIMEPEFNKKSIVEASEIEQHNFAAIIGNAIDTIRAGTQDVLFSMAMTDAGTRSTQKTYESCGYINCALGDKNSWAKTDIIFGDLNSRLDFISFQQMLGQFSRDHENPGEWNTPNPRAYDNMGIEVLHTRIANLSEYLHTKYNKPVFLPYITIATATW
ncbi:MAG: cellulose binding domain-containing protein, partial [Campylobacterota bacterium]|nr:cellulose binding domain-containing protein [Campylobacterota bacterium]